MAKRSPLEQSTHGGQIRIGGRMKTCPSCSTNVHDDSPRCPECGGREVAPEAVSGRGEVYSVTVNHHPWDGGTEPYAIAIIAFPEQPDLRMTSNVVGCPPDEVHIGMPVQVAFEARDDVWFPLFEPVGA